MSTIIPAAIDNACWLTSAAGWASPFLRDPTRIPPPFAEGTCSCTKRSSSWTSHCPSSLTNCVVFSAHGNSTHTSRTFKATTRWRLLTIWTEYPLSADSSCHPLRPPQVLDDLDPAGIAFRQVLQKLQGICTSRMYLPSSHLLPVNLLNINATHLASGGSSDIFQGTYRGREVCVKRLRVSSTGSCEMITKGRIHRGHCQSFAVF